jgi:hypothetical protein
MFHVKHEILGSFIDVDGYVRPQLSYPFGGERQSHPLETIMPEEGPAPLSVGEHENLSFWQRQNRSLLWSAIPGAAFFHGLDRVHSGEYWSGTAFLVGSVVALVALDRIMRRRESQIRIVSNRPTTWKARAVSLILPVVAIATWCAVGFDIADRHFHTLAPQELSAWEYIRVRDGIKGWQNIGSMKNPTPVCVAGFRYSEDNASLAQTLIDAFHNGGCQITKTAELSTRQSEPDVDALSPSPVPTPLPNGVTIHAIEGSPWGEGARVSLENAVPNLNLRRGTKAPEALFTPQPRDWRMPPDPLLQSLPMPNVLIDIGSGSPWKR